ncbi:hypothetical protein NM688_g6826 [Phlebia brevispora]|uniref:Uncharacterized protein n=1 Tax=Phlebia brevispora TaxID=194682 RepID=A0ACC1SC79_9APHY|nr:hypothetical protein NM688_g6826 [Phlebia brevispora]
MLARSKTCSLPADFFTPRPRSTKGKERAVVEEPPEVDAMSRTVLGCCTRPISRRRALSYRERTRLSRRPDHKIGPDMFRMPHPSVVPHSYYLPQRRYASTAPMPQGPQRVFIGATEGEELLKQFTTAVKETPSPDLIESTWAAYDTLRSNNMLNMLSTGEAMLFGNRIVQSLVYRENDPLHTQQYWHLWGNRLLELMQDMDDRIPDNNFVFTRQNWYRLHACALALVGEIDEADRLVSVVDDIPMEFEARTFTVYTYAVLIRCLAYYRNPDSVVEFMINHWDAISTYFSLDSAIRFPENMESAIGAFRGRAYSIIAFVNNPVTLLRQLYEKWPRDKCRIAGLLLIDALCYKELAYDAWGVLRMFREQEEAVPVPQRLSIVKALVKANAFPLANPLFLELSQESGNAAYETPIAEMGLYLFAHQRDVERVDEYARRLEGRGGLIGGHIVLMILVHALRDDPARAVEVFESFFSPKPQGSRQPNIVHFTAVIQAFSRCGDHQGINTWLEKMVQAGFAPDEYVYNVILNCFAQRGEVASVGAVLDQMRASKYPPSRITYTSVIKMLANRKDPVAAEAIYQRAIDEGIEPDSTMVNALMNAHVEAHSWTGVITAFNYLQTVARSRGIGITTSTYNILLKAYVAAGAPFQTVFGYLQKMRKSGAKPDKYTYISVIQSACDAGLMDAAKELFIEMEDQAADWVNGVRVDHYVLTIMMAAHLRLSQKARAKAIYDDMIRRGMHPDAETYRAILSSYSNPRSESSLALAERFLKELLVAHDKTETGFYSVRAGLDDLYKPLLAAYRSRGSKVNVERLLQNLFDEGGSPTLINLSILLDLYRRRGNVEGVRQIWSQLHQLALQESSLDTLFLDKSSSRPRRQGNVLCIALSVYIDALSAAGQHTEVPIVWRTLSSQGFVFDAHNWNHLVVALIRAGEVERAFEVVERVIIPFRQVARKVSHATNSNPVSPLATDLPAEDESEQRRPPEAVPESPLPRRPQTVKEFTKNVAKSKAFMNLEEFDHPLTLLHQVHPLWNAWRPHGVVLVLLYKVMKHLESGQRVHPVQGKALSVSPTAITPDEQEESRRELEPRAILDRLYRDYPRTVKAVLAYREFYHTLKKQRRDYTIYRRRVRKVRQLRSTAASIRFFSGIVMWSLATLLVISVSLFMEKKTISEARKTEIRPADQRQLLPLITQCDRQGGGV